jgi:uncharacterized protein with LGFP repeats
MTDVIGAIAQKWQTLGGAAGFGEPIDIERPTFDGVGRTQPFAGGKFIVWHPELGAFELHGLIAAKWLSLGREQFGYPSTDELGCPDGRGRFNHFLTMQLAGRPVASIYWTPTTAAHEVHGAIRAAWAQHGFERGPVGYPTSDEHDSSAPGGRRNEFEHGFIDWTPQGGAQVHGPVPFDDNA